MTLPPGLLSGHWILLLGLAQALYLIAAAWLAPWRQLRAVPQRLHLVLGSTAFLVVLWMASAKLDHGLRMHLLGVTVVTLTVGGAFAVMAGTLAQLLLVALGHSAVPLVLANALINVGVPVAITTLTLWIARRYGPDNPFIFMLGVGFLGGALSMLALCLTTLGVFIASGDAMVLQQWEPGLLPLVMLPEGFVNGALLSGLVVYAPDWLRTYIEPR